MKNVEHYIVRATKKLGVKTTGIDLEDSEIADAIDTLNNIMLELDAEGIRVGYSIVSAKTDLVTIPDFMEGFVIARLAIDLASDYQVEVPATLVNEERRKRKVISIMALKLSKRQYPSILPKGSGNGKLSSNEFFVRDTQLLDDNEMIIEDDDGYTLTQED